MRNLLSGKLVDKFAMEMFRYKGIIGINLDYLLDNNPRVDTKANQNMEHVDMIDLSDASQFRTNTTHFGRAYKEDNKLVWDHLKSQLLGEQAYNHIRRFNTNDNGRVLEMYLLVFMRVKISSNGCENPHSQKLLPYSTRVTDT